jgi:O-antigen/teichoic acid export membrane protein
MRSSIQVLTSAKFQRRALLIIANSLNTLLLPILSPIVSLLVIRFASVDLWGEFVHVLIIVQLAAHVIAWGSKEYLLREFSFNPAHISRAWQTSLISRLALMVPLYLLVSLSGLPSRRLALVVLWLLGQTLYQSYDVLILYKRAFFFSVLVELGGLIALVSTIIWLRSSVDLDMLIALFGIAHLAKAAVFVLRFRQQTLDRSLGRFDTNYFVLAFPFFLLGFSGMLQSRIDLYCVNYFLSRSEVGQYQVFVNFLIYVQTASYFVLNPFVKSIYRLGYSTILKMSLRLFTLGILMAIPALVAVHLILSQLYHFTLPWYFLLGGGLFVVPVFFYLPIIYTLYKANLQMVVVKINLLGIAINLLLSLLLLPRVGMFGAVLAIALAQWSMFAAYLVHGRVVRDDRVFAVSELS